MDIAFKGLEFNKRKHTYKTEDGIELTPVTEWVHSFFTPFDKKKIALLSAKKHGKTSKEIQKEWKKKTLDGTKIHEYLQSGKEVKEKDFHLKGYVDAGRKYIGKECHATGNPYQQEVQLYNTSLGIAGTADMVILGDGGFRIVDWKTSAEMTMQNKYQLTDAESPVAHLHDSKFVHYTLQLSAYATMLHLKYAIPIVGLELVQLHQDGTYTVHRVDYLAATIENMAWRKKNETRHEKDI